MTKRDKERLRSYADKKGKTISEFVRDDFILAFLAREDYRAQERELQKRKTAYAKAEANRVQRKRRRTELF